jgi:iron complex transport system substrate-binding protein
VRARRAALILLTLFALGACSDAPLPEHKSGTYQRVVTLAPNLTELVYAAGAGSSLIGVSAYSDYPPAALELPIVGDAFMIDQEQLAILKPDLLLVWQSGTPAHVVDELRRAGFNVEVIRTSSLADVASAIRRIGLLTGHGDDAEVAVSAYERGLESIAEGADQLTDIRVFYQVSQRPLYTVSGDHYVSELIALCGGSNVFADLDELAPTIDVESVVERDPEVLLASTDAGENAFAEWQRWPHMAANAAGNQFLMPADAIGRATPRLLQAGEAVCDALAEARRRRGDTGQ